MAEKLSSRMQQRRTTTSLSSVTSTDAVAQGEILYSTKDNEFVFGDGTSTTAQLVGKRFVSAGDTWDKVISGGSSSVVGTDKKTIARQVAFSGATEFTGNSVFNGQMNVNGKMVVSSNMYGTTLPSTGIEGQLFFKI